MSTVRSYAERLLLTLSLRDSESKLRMSQRAAKSVDISLSSTKLFNVGYEAVRGLIRQAGDVLVKRHLVRRRARAAHGHGDGQDGVGACE